MFEGERTTFQEFKTRLDSDHRLREEVESAIRALLSDYNTTIHENRFLVGGVCEHIIGTAMRAAGIDAENIGKYSPRIDVKIPNAEGYSVKGEFIGGGEIRLINVLGKGLGQAWREGTIFIISGMGIAYADPEILPSATVSRGDAIALRRGPLVEFLENKPEYLIRCDVPRKSVDIKGSKMASETVAREILDKLPTLRNFR